MALRYLLNCAKISETLLKGVNNMLEAKRKKGESFESFLRRFNKRMLQSGVILEFKSKRFFEPFKSKGMTKKSALIRKKFREKMDYLRKIGKVPEEFLTKKKKY